MDGMCVLWVGGIENFLWARWARVMRESDANFMAIRGFMRVDWEVS